MNPHICRLEIGSLVRMDGKKDDYESGNIFNSVMRIYWSSSGRKFLKLIKFWRYVFGFKRCF